jgi:hypothetical protein
VGGGLAGVVVAVAGFHGLSLVAALAVVPAAAVLLRARPVATPA